MFLAVPRYNTSLCSKAPPAHFSEPSIRDSAARLPMNRNWLIPDSVLGDSVLVSHAHGDV